jgi:hypothetical protein
MKTILAGVLLVGAMLSANAATIEYKGVIDGSNTVLVTGLIVPGDADRYEGITASLVGPTTVFLQSPGGAVVDGLNIGIAIHRSGYSTEVPVNATCASICGLIWLAGEPRLLAATSKIGFHAAFRVEDGQESGRANALIGAYLSRLGLSYQAIAYLTEASPDDMQWLNPDDAAKVGITYKLIEPPRSEPRPFIAQPRLQPPYQPMPPAQTGSTAEQQARRLVLDYHALWSQGGPNVEGLATYYSDTVSFYGTTVLRDKVMDEKRKFSIRFRSVTTQSIRAACSSTVTAALAPSPG